MLAERLDQIGWIQGIPGVRLNRLKKDFLKVPTKNLTLNWFEEAIDVANIISWRAWKLPRFTLEIQIWKHGYLELDFWDHPIPPSKDWHLKGL